MFNRVQKVCKYLPQSLDIISDIHLENIGSFPLKPKRNSILCLTGDIGTFEDQIMLKSFLKDAVTKYGRVLYVPGNHEYYSQGQWTHGTLDKIWKNTCEEIGIDLLQNKSLIVNTTLGPTRFLGTTLWSGKSRITLNDYTKIWKTPQKRGEKCLITMEDTRRWHEEAVEFLGEELGKNKDIPTVVLTHHAPLLVGTSDPMYGDSAEGFATDLSHLFEPHVKLWAFGHTHYPCDFMYKGTRVVSNPMGYEGELVVSRAPRNIPLFFK